MSYREAFLFGWSIAWRQAVWTAAAALPLRVLTAPVSHGNLILGTLLAILTVLVILPYSVRAAAKLPGGFRVQAEKSGTVSPLTYEDSLQVTALAVLVSMALGGIHALLQPPAANLGAAAGIPLLLLAVYPAIAELAISVPYRGFRLVVTRGITHPARQPSGTADSGTASTGFTPSA